MSEHHQGIPQENDSEQEQKPIGNESRYLQDLVEYDSKRAEFHLPDREHDGSSWLDGNFGRYSILSGYANKDDALLLLRTLAAILLPYMKYAGIHVHLFGELDPILHASILGEYHIQSDSQIKRIRIKLRHNADHSKFKPLNELLGTMCHELAHCKSITHDITFWVNCKLIIDWVELSLGRRIIIPRQEPELRQLQWADDLYAPIMEDIGVPESDSAKQAAWSWEKNRHGWSKYAVDPRKFLEGFGMWV
jgi:hypothetical protein